jgi:hypothetical protein
MVKTLAVALTVLIDLPSVTVATVPAPVPASGWTNVTPAGVDLTNELPCGNFGSITVVADPARLSNLFAQFHCQGVWKSVDYGLTWFGPINTGEPGPAEREGSLLREVRMDNLQSFIRGTGLGFWKSTDGGVSWTDYRVAPVGDRQRFYPPVVDPYDPNHLLMTGHQSSLIVQSLVEV